MVCFPLIVSVDVSGLVAFGTMMYLRPATMAIDCGADRSASIAILFGVTLVVVVSDRTLAGIAIVIADLLIEFKAGTFFVDRFCANGVVCSAALGLTIFSSVCCSFRAAA